MKVLIDILPSFDYPPFELSCDNYIKTLVMDSKDAALRTALGLNGLDLHMDADLLYKPSKGDPTSVTLEYRPLFDNGTLGDAQEVALDEGALVPFVLTVPIVDKLDVFHSRTNIVTFELRTLDPSGDEIPSAFCRQQPLEFD